MKPNQINDKLVAVLNGEIIPTDFEITTQQFVEVVRPLLLSAIYRSAEAFAECSKPDKRKRITKGELKSLSTAAKAFADNAKTGFHLLKELDELKPKGRINMNNIVPIKQVVNK